MSRDSGLGFCLIFSVCFVLLFLLLLYLKFEVSFFFLYSCTWSHTRKFLCLFLCFKSKFWLFSEDKENFRFSTSPTCIGFVHETTLECFFAFSGDSSLGCLFDLLYRFCWHSKCSMFLLKIFLIQVYVSGTITLDEYITLIQTHQRDPNSVPNFWKIFPLCFLLPKSLRFSLFCSGNQTAQRR